MIFVFVLYIVLILIGIEYKKKDNGLSFSQTEALKGIGIITVFFNHIYNDYLTPHKVLHHPYMDEPFVFFESTTTVLFVGMFLFFSGYGIYESVKKKGDIYISQIPIKRIATTLLNFDIAVLVFLIVNIFLSSDLTLKKVILAFIGWESLGNSNWYIFAILVCYFIGYVAFSFFKDRKRSLVVILLMILLYCLLMYEYRYPWWYNTIFCYPCGMYYSEYKEKINKIIKNNYIVSLITTMALFTGSLLNYSNVVMCNVAAIFFCMLCVIISMNVGLNSKPLIWLGSHLFPLYIYQRLPMYVIDHSYPIFICKNPYLFVIICATITLIIARFILIIKLEKSK